MPVSDPIGVFLGHLAASFFRDDFIRLVLTSPVGGDVQRVTGRCVRLKMGTVLSLTLHEPRHATTRNLPLDQVSSWLRGQFPDRFRGALLETSVGNWQLAVNRRGGIRVVAHKAAALDVPPRGHDRQKPVWLDDSARPWLTALGVCDAEGKVRASMTDKHRQIERYLEILSHLVRDCGWIGESCDSGVAPLNIVDMGCGKGYLTFGIWHLFHRLSKTRANVIGIECRAELVRHSNAVARSAGCNTLTFREGTIADTELPGLDALIALHACNTATDDALRRGIDSGARLIVVSPCCHQELRPQLGRPAPFDALLRHGLMAERFSEWLTDGLRVLHLEAAGYATKVIEFVAAEHTPRNLLIAGIRRESGIDRGRARKAIRELKTLFGIGPLAMDDPAKGAQVRADRAPS